MEKNLLRDTAEIAKLFCEKYINEESTAVDATCGNGNDTLWLARRCAKVYAFDLQHAAIETTGKLICSEGLNNVTLINDSHANMAEYVKQSPRAVMFNLGYLPGGDKNITTEPEITLKALEEALEILDVNGIICVTIYWGHPRGAIERKELLQWSESLDKGRYHCIHLRMINQPNCPPEILLITKKH